MSWCYECAQRATHVCGDCYGAMYCGTKCFEKGHKEACPALIEGRKRQRNKPTTLAATRTVEEARELIAQGADPYAYIGNGQVALDEMVKWYPIREFLREARVQPVPKELQQLLEEARENTVDAGVDEWVLPKDAINVELGPDYVGLFIYHGFFPVFPIDTADSEVYLEHLFFQRYNGLTLTFWLQRSPKRILRDIEYWVYRTMAGHVAAAEKSPGSWALALFAPQLVYKGSRRAITTMAQFRTVDSPILAPSVPRDNYIPVTRYSAGMTRGLFYEGGDDDDERYCGTFYYYEPESTTFLRYDRAYRTKDKYTAVKELGYMRMDDVADTQVEFPPYDEDFMMTPLEYHLWKPDAQMAWDYPKEGRKFYTAAFTVNAYGLQDSLDQIVCAIARHQGYDIVTLEQMVGSRQIVTEVLDTRDRSESFKNLYFTVN